MSANTDTNTDTPAKGNPVENDGEIRKAEIITIGDEILRGEIVDSNKALLSEQLLGIHVDSRFHTSVLDDRVDMSDAIRRAVSRCDIVLLSGGLGPTRDDITTEVVADCFGRKLVLDQDVLDAIRSFFAQLSREMSENNAKQALFPEGATILANPIGTAPGFMIEESGSLLFAMPGVPHELKLMLEEQVLPRISAHFGVGGVVRARLLRTFGLGESSLDDELQSIARRNEEDPAGTRDVDVEGTGGAVRVELGFRTTFPDNFLRPVVRASSREEAESHLDEVCREIRDLLGPLVYGEGEQTMAGVVGTLLRDRGIQIATAESCTGGLIAERITDEAGSSDYFAGGVVSYSNEAKSALLGVPADLIEAHGAVSKPVAIAMAEGVRKRFGTELGVATTGISGPSGGSEQKPVGLVFIALAREGHETHCESFIFPLDRSRHRALTAQVALDWVRRSLLEVELVGPSLLRRRGGAAPPAGGRG